MASEAEKRLAELLAAEGGELAEFVEQLPFAKAPYANPPIRSKKGRVRQWKMDFAWPRVRFAVEVEGLTPWGGRHQRIDGFRKDAEKHEAALLLGWTIYRIPAEWVTGGRRRRVVWNIRKLLAARKDSI